MSINIDENITFVYACMGNDQQECKEKEQISLKGVEVGGGGGGGGYSQKFMNQ